MSVYNSQSNQRKPGPFTLLSQQPLNSKKPAAPAVEDQTTMELLSMKKSPSDRSISLESINSVDEQQDEKYLEYVNSSPQEVEQLLFKSLCDGDRQQFIDLLERVRPSVMLTILLTFSYQNRHPNANIVAASKANLAMPLRNGSGKSSPVSTAYLGPMLAASQLKSSIMSMSNNNNNILQRHYFGFDADILPEAHALLGTSTSPLNLIQIACMLGDEDIASDILDYVYEQTVPRGQKILLVQFLGQTWGDGNTTLHLASFQGMSDVVRRLLECGAATRKRNGRGYKAVDCTDDQVTREIFQSGLESYASLSLDQLKVGSERRPTSMVSNSPPKRTASGGILVNSFSSSSSLNSIRLKTKPLKWEPHLLLIDYAKNGEVDAIKELVKSKKVDIDCRTPHTGLTPLHMACAYGHLEVVKFLIEQCRADIDVKDSEGWSVLHSIIAEVPEPILVASGPNDKHDALERDRFLKVLRYVLELPGIDLRAVTEDGETIVDVIKEIDDEGSIDVEIYEIIEQASSSRGINLGKFEESQYGDDDYTFTSGGQTDDELESMSSSKTVTPTKPLVAVRTTPSNKTVQLPTPTSSTIYRPQPQFKAVVTESSPRQSPQLAALILNNSKTSSVQNIVAKLNSAPSSSLSSINSNEYTHLASRRNSRLKLAAPTNGHNTK